MSAALKARIKPLAVRQIDAAALWWRDNRPSAPGAIRADLKAALDVLVEQSGIGTSVENSRNTEVRRLYLARTGYFIYYRVRDQTLEVIAFWHASRERVPGIT